MAKIRVHELAKELQKENKEIIQFLQDKGHEGKTASSGLDDELAGLVRAAFGAKAPAAKEEKPAKPQEEKENREEKAANAKPVESAKENAAAEAPKKKKMIIVLLDMINIGQMNFKLFFF